MPSILPLPASCSGGHHIHILLFPENRAFRDKGAHLSLHPACAWHLQAHLLHQHDWQSSPKGGFLGAQDREGPGDWASDPSEARAPGTYSVTLIALAAWLTPQSGDSQEAGGAALPPLAPPAHPDLLCAQGVALNGSGTLNTQRRAAQEC